ncbi:MAG: TonB family protein [Verrucomicrobiota bacterium]
MTKTPDLFFWRRFGLVTAAHMVILLFLLFAFKIPHQEKQEFQFIELVDLEGLEAVQVPSPVQRYQKPVTNQHIAKPASPSNRVVREIAAPPKPKVAQKVVNPVEPANKKSEPTQAAKKPQPNISTKIVTRSKEPLKPSPVVTRLSQSSKQDIQKRLHSVLGQTAYSDSARSNTADWYNALIIKSVKSNWMKPSNENPLVAQMSVTIKPDGSIIYNRIIKSSQKAAFDQSIVKAIQATKRVSQPLPSNLGNPSYQVTLQFE